STMQRFAAASSLAPPHRDRSGGVAGADVQEPCVGAEDGEGHPVGAQGEPDAGAAEAEPPERVDCPPLGDAPHVGLLERIGRAELRIPRGGRAVRGRPFRAERVRAELGTPAPRAWRTVMRTKSRRPLKPSSRVRGSALILVPPPGRWMTCVIGTGWR